jgi:cyclohexyl-isocyanide hydratase
MLRRDFAKQLGTALLTGGLMGELRAYSQALSPSTGQTTMPHAMPSGPPLEIAMLVYPGMTALDLVAPQTVFAELMSTRVELVWKSKETIISDTGIPIVPTLSFADCPAEPDIVFVGGGTKGTWALMNDPAVIGFLQSRGAKAKLVTSVCTGSLVLGAAGLLNGYKATSHWVARDLLLLFGATPVNARVVEDRNRITGAGVTAGMDFALRIATRLRGDEYAQALQLANEYDPQPPFKAGNPQDASPKVRDFVSGYYAPTIEEARVEAMKARKRLGLGVGN